MTLKTHRSAGLRSFWALGVDLRAPSHWWIEIFYLETWQKYPGDAAPNASSTTRLVQRFRDTGSVADRKQSGRVPIVKRKATDGETTVQKKSIEKTVRLHKHHYRIHILAEQ
ncbi:hypothetical protein TNCV_1738891 [Trichonephila clavipes]|nr:hypothetical protein TNCV_1738891 [Trichonephila clavipes]